MTDVELWYADYEEIGDGVAGLLMTGSLVPSDSAAIAMLYKKVWQGEMEEQDAPEVAQTLFHETNTRSFLHISAPGLENIESLQDLRSMSVGDMVRIDGEWLICRNVGWQPWEPMPGGWGAERTIEDLEHVR